MLEPGAGQAALVVGGVAVGETVRQDEVELLAGEVVAGRLAASVASDGGWRAAVSGGGGRDERGGQRGHGDRGDAGRTAMASAVPRRRWRWFTGVNLLAMTAGVRVATPRAYAAIACPYGLTGRDVTSAGQTEKRGFTR